MKNFSDLLATKLTLEVMVNGHAATAGLHENLKFQASDVVEIDGVEILPRYRYLAQDGVLTINEPFYRWLHSVSGQGWLLKPYRATNS